jgi:hypothetical protein
MRKLHRVNTAPAALDKLGAIISVAKDHSRRTLPQRQYLGYRHATQNRKALLSKIPIVEESGVKDFISTTFYSLIAPPKSSYTRSRFYGARWRRTPGVERDGWIDETHSALADGVLATLRARVAALDDIVRPH